MFHTFGNLVSRAWVALLAVWVTLFVTTWWIAPPWKQVARDEEFAFLPADMPSRQAEDIFRKAFPDEPLGSNLVLVLCRDGPAGLKAEDRQFIEDVLRPGLLQIAKDEGGLANQPDDTTDTDPFSTAPAPARKKSIIARLLTPDTPGAGALLLSADGRSALLVAELTTEFLAAENWQTIERVEKLIGDIQAQTPAGLRIHLTGSAVVGRDRLRAQYQSAQATGLWTVILVVVLLVVIYRAPVLALIPLATVYLAVRFSLNVLAILAGHRIITLFEGIEIYITVVAYGAGVDYCLFLIARYREELEGGTEPGTALANALGKVGPALTASAATVMCGIGMMTFARFGKFREAGLAMPLSIFVVLCATLTFSTALLRLVGIRAFWPHLPRPATAPVPAASLWTRLLSGDGLDRTWKRLGELLQRRPGTCWLTSVIGMAPFAALALAAGRLSYDWVENLPADAPSVAGTQALRQHFPAGLMGPVTVLIVNPDVHFDQPEGRDGIAQLTKTLQEQRAELGLADVLSQTSPLGLTEAGQRGLDQLKLPKKAVREGMEQQAREHFLTDLGERGFIGSRLELIFEANPFSRAGIENLRRLEERLPELLPASLRAGAQLHYAGATASTWDLKQVTNGDGVRIEALVLASVYVILVLVLRQPAISIYLLLSVLLSFYTTLGLTLGVFWALNPQSFTGLDWKVGIFLFTILIAVGADYNIFLMTRVHEEQRKHGPVRGIIEALVRTGPIISSCGVIMAGTFGSLMVGSLSEMKQLGFALATGVLLDTFLVRPILVPAFLVMVYEGRLNLSRWLHPAVGRRPLGFLVKRTGTR
jgi:RND superfamily putative drug exporter